RYAGTYRRSRQHPIIAAYSKNPAGFAADLGPFSPQHRTIMDQKADTEQGDQDDCSECGTGVRLSISDQTDTENNARDRYRSDLNGGGRSGWSEGEQCRGQQNEYTARHTARRYPEPMRQPTDADGDITGKIGQG